VPWNSRVECFLFFLLWSFHPAFQLLPFFTLL
jgi:hypothetical protein